MLLLLLLLPVIKINSKRKFLIEKQNKTKTFLKKDKLQFIIIIIFKIIFLFRGNHRSKGSNDAEHDPSLPDGHNIVNYVELP